MSQDPIRIASNNPTFYAYVSDSNSWIDPLGLSSLIQIILTEGQEGGDHYKLIYEDGKRTRTTDFQILRGEPDVRNGKGRFDKNLLETKNMSITRSNKGIGRFVDDFGEEFKDAWRKNKKLDCFDYVSQLAKKLGAKIDIDPSLSNRKNFANIC